MTEKQELTAVRRRKADVAWLKSERNNMKVSQPNLFSCEALTSRSLKIMALSPSLKSAQDFGSRLRRRESASSLSVITPRGFHPFPSRTRELSPAGPMVLHAKVCGRLGRRRHKIKGQSERSGWPFPFLRRAVCLSKEPSHGKSRLVAVFGGGECSRQGKRRVGFERHADAGVRDLRESGSRSEHRQHHGMV